MKNQFVGVIIRFIVGYSRKCQGFLKCDVVVLCSPVFLNLCLRLDTNYGQLEHTHAKLIIKFPKFIQMWQAPSFIHFCMESSFHKVFRHNEPWENCLLYLLAKLSYASKETSATRRGRFYRF